MKQASIDNPNGIVDVDFEGDLQEFQDDLREYEQVSAMPKGDDSKAEVSTINQSMTAVVTSNM